MNSQFRSAVAPLLSAERPHLVQILTMEHANRYRSYSRESGASSTLSGGDGGGGGNRSRANTGGTDDSTLSSSDNSSKYSKMLGPRRRSHRPRGCRGGRKNRKNKNKEALTIPKEIIGGNTPLSPRDNLRKTASGQTDRDLKHDHSTSTFWNTQSTPDENSMHTANFPPLSHPTMPPPSYCSNQNMDPAQSNAFMFPPVLSQSSFLPPHTGNATDHSTHHVGMNTNAGSILPPLPVAEAKSNAPAFDGPNPYALSYVKDQSSQSQPKSQPYEWTNTINTKPSSSNAIHISLQLNQLQGMELMANCRLESTTDYRSQPFDKQSQQLTDGGSLFATSPRSFLMGANSGAVGVSW